MVNYGQIIAMGGEAANSQVKFSSEHDTEGTVYLNSLKKVGSVNNITLEMKKLNSDEIRDDLFLIDNKDYYEIGADVGDIGTKATAKKDIKRYAEPEYRISTVVGIYKKLKEMQEAGKLHGVPKVLFTTGIPADHELEDKNLATELITNNLKKTHTVNDMIFEIVAVEVILQPMATLFKVICLPDGTFNKTVADVYKHKRILIADIGWGTFDAIEINKLNRGEIEEGEGIKAAFNRIKKNIKGLSSISLHQIDEDWRNSHKDYIGNPGDEVKKLDPMVQEVFQNAFMDYSKSIISKLEEKYEVLAKYDEIWFTGGGSIVVYEDYIKKLPEFDSKRFKLIDSAQLANAQGYQKVAKRKANQLILANGVE